MNYFVMALKKYAVFSGRSRRAEYWYFILFSTIITFIVTFIDIAVSTGTGLDIQLLGTLYGLAVVLPSLGVLVRRLHDTGRSGWYVFISIIPVIGMIVLLVWLATDSQSGMNQYGPNPKEANNSVKNPSAANGFSVENNFAQSTIASAPSVTSTATPPSTPPSAPTSNLS